MKKKKNENKRTADGIVVVMECLGNNCIRDEFRRGFTCANEIFGSVRCGMCFEFFFRSESRLRFLGMIHLGRMSKMKRCFGKDVFFLLIYLRICFILYF